MTREGWRRRLVLAGFAGLRATRAHRFAPEAVRGLGAVLMFHHVRPAKPTLNMNRGLHVTPEFLAEVVETLLDLGFDILSLDGALAALGRPERRRPFAALTFDDGYRDNREYAEPILRRYGAPFTVYVAPGLSDGAVRAWWEDLETAIQRLPFVRGCVGGQAFELPARNRQEKEAAGDALGARFRAASAQEARREAARLLESSGLDASSGDPQFMDWSELRELAETPLCTIGAHTVTHPRLAALEAGEARREILDSKRRVEAEIGRPVRHFAYPYGGPDAAAGREFAMAREAGFASAATTRPGMVFSDHRAHLHALPRLSINGAWQSRHALEALLSGIPFALWNRGRRLNVL